MHSMDRIKSASLSASTCFEWALQCLYGDMAYTMCKHKELMLQHIRSAELLQYVSLIKWISDTAAVYLQLAMLALALQFVFVERCLVSSNCTCQKGCIALSSCHALKDGC